MSHQDFEKNIQIFLDLTRQQSKQTNTPVDILRHQYIEQNLHLMNDILQICIDNLKKLEKTQSTNDIICNHAKLTNELNKKVSQSNQQFLDLTIGQMGDHNEWLKAHCDLATD